MKLSFQLFSARMTPIDQALALIRAAGYESVEAYRDNIAEGEAFSAAISEAGISVVSLHINLDPLRDAAEASVATANELGVTHVVCPYLEEELRPISKESWIALATEMGAIARFWTEQGFTFAWHNHDFEFFPLEDGTMPIALLLDQAPELHWEIDVAWIVRAGADPVEWIEKYGDRISAVHIKDLAASGECLDEDGWADVGHGVVDWANLLPMLRQGPATIYAVEHDNPSDLERFANRSRASIEALLA